jgi:hypothetical protein
MEVEVGILWICFGVSLGVGHHPVLLKYSMHAFVVVELRLPGRSWSKETILYLRHLNAVTTSL